MLTLIRGVSGSGKTTLAQQMLKEGRVQKHFEADMFFTDSQGVYKYDPAKIKEAHALLDRVEIIFDSWITQLKAL